MLLLFVYLGLHLLQCLSRRLHVCLSFAQSSSHVWLRGGVGRMLLEGSVTLSTFASFVYMRRSLPLLSVARDEQVHSLFSSLCVQTTGYEPSRSYLSTHTLGLGTARCVSVPILSMARRRQDMFGLILRLKYLKSK
jgi:hypothetical protein